jgi:C-terminal processing protease CtpA/Prc
MQPGGKSGMRQDLSLLRQPLPQVAAVYSIVHDPANPSRMAQYIRINYFCSDATKAVMAVCSLRHVAAHTRQLSAALMRTFPLAPLPLEMHGKPFELCTQAIIEGEVSVVDGYIIDLRNNPGGVFEEAIAIASYFLTSQDPSGRDTHIVETVRYTDSTTHRDLIDNAWTVGTLPSELFPPPAAGLTTRPVVLLTNGGTASASEVMAGALQVRCSP